MVQSYDFFFDLASVVWFVVWYIYSVFIVYLSYIYSIFIVCLGLLVVGLCFLLRMCWGIFFVISK